jgi:hypothetical protein
MAAIFAAAGVAGAVAYASSNPRACTLIGSETGVFVGLGLDHLAAVTRSATERLDDPRAPLAQRRRRIERFIRSKGVRRVVACANAGCHEATVGDIVSNEMLVTLKANGPDLVHVTLAVDRRDRPLQLAAGAVRLQRDEPNGPGCGTYWNAAVQVRGSRLVTMR